MEKWINQTHTTCFLLYSQNNLLRSSVIKEGNITTKQRV